MKKQVSPVVFIALVVVAVIGLGFISWKALTGTSDPPGVIVKPANPNDPKYQPDPKLGLGGAGPGVASPP